MDELVRRAALNGALREVLVPVRAHGRTWMQFVGYVAMDREHIPLGDLTAVAKPMDAQILRKAMREEWKLA